jgi:hypothetical protein
MKKDGSYFKTASAAQAGATRKIKKEGLDAIALIAQNQPGQYYFTLKETKQEMKSQDETINELKRALKAAQDELAQIKQEFEDFKNQTRHEELSEIFPEYPESGFTEQDAKELSEDMNKRVILTLERRDEALRPEETKEDVFVDKSTPAEQAFNMLRGVLPEVPEFDDEYFQAQVLKDLASMKCENQDQASESLKVIEALAELTTDKFGLVHRYLNTAAKTREIEFSFGLYNKQPAMSNKDIVEDLLYLGKCDVPTLRDPKVKEIILTQEKIGLQVLEEAIYNEKIFDNASSRQHYYEALASKRKIAISNLMS